MAAVVEIQANGQMVQRPSRLDLRSLEATQMQGLPVLDLSSGRIPENAIDPNPERAQARDVLGLPPLLDTATNTEHMPTIVWARRPKDPLPWVRSDVVAIVTIAKADAYLSKSGSIVYSVYKAQPSKVLKGQSLLPTAGNFEFERGGGLVKYPSGKLIAAGTQHLGILRSGYQYVVFLHTARNGTGLQVITAFRASTGGTLAVDDDGGPEASSYDGIPLSQLLAAIDQKRQTAAQKDHQ
jgi:hypothetical protein